MSVIGYLELRGVDNAIVGSKEGEADGEEQCETNGCAEGCVDTFLLDLGKG